MLFSRLSLVLVAMTFQFSLARADVFLSGFGSFYGFYQDFDSSPLLNSPDTVNFDSRSRIGLNISAGVNSSNTLLLHGQILADGQSSINAWNTETDFAFLKYLMGDHVEFRLGRQIFPSWLAAEYQDISYELPFSAIPRNVINIAPFKSLNGVSASYRQFFPEASLNHRIFFGNESETFAFSDSSTEIQYTNVFGYSVLFATDESKLQFSIFSSEVDVSSSDETLEEGLGRLTAFSEDLVTFTLSATSRWDRWSFFTEYGRLAIKESNEEEDRNEGLYSLFSYQLTDYFSPRYMFVWSNERSVDLFSHQLGLSYRLMDGLQATFETGYEEDSVNGETERGMTFLLGVDFVY